MDVYVGFDIGTTVLKGHAITDEGTTVAQIAIDRGPKPATVADANTPIPEVWWTEFVDASRALVASLGHGYRPRAVAVTGMVPNVALFTEQMTTIPPTLLFYDDRAYEIELALDAQLKTDKWQNEVLSKLIWLKRHLGEDWGRVGTWTSTHSYVNYRLTGNLVLDTVTASECGTVFDPDKRGWNSRVIKEFGLDTLNWPDLSPALNPIGELTRQASNLTGLPTGIPVACGTSDSIASMLGSGLRRSSDCFVYFGTFNCAATLRYEMSEILTGNHADFPISWLTSIPRAGHQIQQIANILNPSSKSPLKCLDTLANRSSPGANGLTFIPNLQLDRSTVSSNPDGGFFHLTPSHGRSDIARATLEAFGYTLLHTARAELTASKGSILVSGGGARSRVWRQITADILNVALTHTQGADRGLGSAILAYCSSMGGSPGRAIDAMAALTSAEPTVPRTGSAEAYVGGLRAYQKILNILYDNPGI